MKPLGARLTAFVLAVGLGQFLWLQARSAWTNYWLLEDARKGTATVTNELWSGHNAVGYSYTVDQKQYVGRSGRNWKAPNKVQIGEQADVYFSASRPWLSRLYIPEAVVEGLPGILIALLLEAFALITLINPRSGWAFSLIDKERKNAG